MVLVNVYHVEHLTRRGGQGILEALIANVVVGGRIGTHVSKSWRTIAGKLETYLYAVVRSPYFRQLSWWVMMNNDMRLFSQEECYISVAGRVVEVGDPARFQADPVQGSENAKA